MIDVILGNRNLTQFLMQVLVLVFSLSVHEYAHARTALRLGDDTAAHLGRLSLNPLVHLEPIGALLILAGAPIAWAKPVPVNPRLFKRNITTKKGFAIVSLAGPVSNLILSFIAANFVGVFNIVLSKLLMSGAGTSGFATSLVANLLSVFSLMYYLNLYLAVFNLLPVPPLDGSKIFATVLPDRASNWLLRNERFIGIFLLMAIVFSPSLITRVMSVVTLPFQWVIGKPVALFYQFIAKLVL